MIYLPELHFFYDQNDFPTKKAVFVIAKFCAKKCNGFEAKLLAPRSKNDEKTKEGSLSKVTKQREAKVKELLEWIYDNSLFDLYYFKLFRDYPKNKEAMFDHHDDTCCWILRLINEAEFSELKEELRKNHLPKNLFYPESAGICIPVTPGPIIKFLNLIGFNIKASRCYSPLRIEEEQKKKK